MGGSVLRGVLGLGAVLCCAVARWGVDGSTLGPELSAPPSLFPTPALAFPLHASLLFSQGVSEPQSYRWKPTTDPGGPAAGSLFQRPCPRLRRCDRCTDRSPKEALVQWRLQDTRARGWCCWGPQGKEVVALLTWRVWAGRWAESLQRCGRGGAGGRAASLQGWGRGRGHSPPAWSVVLTLMPDPGQSMFARCRNGCTDPSSPVGSLRTRGHPPLGGGDGCCGLSWLPAGSGQAVPSRPSPPPPTSQFLGPLAPAALQGSAATVGEGPCVPLSGWPCPIASGGGAGLVGSMTSETDEAHGAPLCPSLVGQTLHTRPGVPECRLGRNHKARVCSCA